ncbi:hypothetical protein A3742_16215 [Oleiphilus sp. HI0071]|nr:hypothetical protein A3737_36675 [Oleiphilus sp. HI0065]KZY86834.1 hypothetical protein A3742_16215 [Oleiphilus sp. HI0071]KZY94633.1 hypothetical protein A3744_35220 [Oleiphilus sp. HI0073]KZZ13891.1 hypothetical protein A3750_02660 [Oleiphilus sp. HI0079]KZZ14322.1 hypothetical protein A3751_18490 [Oleiphilus sp. HI0080]KZZ43409.1 hypothetical protein A3758_15260 [Oleiphilus sp. HI0118]KZZ47931.1 hypothetical protein A3760_15575 [Oleiphilus sp. HI0122]KZZ73103.1 hypothetical protein A37
MYWCVEKLERSNSAFAKGESRGILPRTKKPRKHNRRNMLLSTKHRKFIEASKALKDIEGPIPVQREA